MISSLENKTIKQLTKLHLKKYRNDSFLLMDEKLIEAAYRHDYLKQLIYVGDIPFEYDNSLEVSKEVMNKLSGGKDIEYLGVSRLIEENKNYGSRVIILDRLQDPLNIARIMEGAMLFGFDSIILSENCADIYNDKCLNNCKAGIYELNISHGDLIDEINILKDKGFKVYATGLSDNTCSLDEIREDEKMAFVFGNEGSGVSDEIMNACDKTLKIDMFNIDSLNVAMAASIVLYRFKKVL